MPYESPWPPQLRQEARTLREHANMVQELQRLTRQRVAELNENTQTSKKTRSGGVLAKEPPVAGASSTAAKKQATKRSTAQSPDPRGSNSRERASKTPQRSILKNLSTSTKPSTKGTVTIVPQPTPKRATKPTAKATPKPTIPTTKQRVIKGTTKSNAKPDIVQGNNRVVKKVTQLTIHPPRKPVPKGVTFNARPRGGKASQGGVHRLSGERHTVDERPVEISSREESEDDEDDNNNTQSPEQEVDEQDEEGGEEEDDEKQEEEEEEDIPNRTSSAPPSAPPSSPPPSENPLIYSSNGRKRRARSLTAPDSDPVCRDYHEQTLQVHKRRKMMEKLIHHREKLLRKTQAASWQAQRSRGKQPDYPIWTDKDGNDVYDQEPPSSQWSLADLGEEVDQMADYAVDGCASNLPVDVTGRLYANRLKVANPRPNKKYDFDGIDDLEAIDDTFTAAILKHLDDYEDYEVVGTTVTVKPDNGRGGQIVFDIDDFSSTSGLKVKEAAASVGRRAKVATINVGFDMKITYSNEAFKKHKLEKEKAASLVDLTTTSSSNQPTTADGPTINTKHRTGKLMELHQVKLAALAEEGSIEGKITKRWRCTSADCRTQGLCWVEESSGKHYPIDAAAQGIWAKECAIGQATVEEPSLVTARGLITRFYETQSGSSDTTRVKKKGDQGVLESVNKLIEMKIRMAEAKMNTTMYTEVSRMASEDQSPYQQQPHQQQYYPPPPPHPHQYPQPYFYPQPQYPQPIVYNSPYVQATVPQMAPQLATTQQANPQVVPSTAAQALHEESRPLSRPPSRTKTITPPGLSKAIPPIAISSPAVPDVDPSESVSQFFEWLLAGTKDIRRKAQWNKVYGLVDQEGWDESDLKSWECEGPQLDFARSKGVPDGLARRLRPLLKRFKDEYRQGTIARAEAMRREEEDQARAATEAAADTLAAMVGGGGDLGGGFIRDKRHQ